MLPSLLLRLPCFPLFFAGYPRHSSSYNTHLAEVNEVIIEDDIHRAWKLPSRRLLWHLLDALGLMISIQRQPVFRLQQVTILIL